MTAVKEAKRQISVLTACPDYFGEQKRLQLFNADKQAHHCKDKQRLNQVNCRIINDIISSYCSIKEGVLNKRKRLIIKNHIFPFLKLDGVLLYENQIEFKGATFLKLKISNFDITNRNMFQNCIFNDTVEFTDGYKSIIKLGDMRGIDFIDCKFQKGMSIQNVDFSGVNSFRYSSFKSEIIVNGSNQGVIDFGNVDIQDAEIDTTRLCSFKNWSSAKLNYVQIGKIKNAVDDIKFKVKGEYGIFTKKYIDNS